MSDGLTELELKSAHQVKALIGDVLDLLAHHFNGETTLNHLRIGHYIGLQSLYNDASTSNKDISETLHIPRSTVSRVVADFVDKGWVIEQPNPDDGRGKQLYITPEHPAADEFEQKFRYLINDIIDRVAAKKLVAVDPKKRAFKADAYKPK